jgi:hypothetical protein
MVPNAPKEIDLTKFQKEQTSKILPKLFKKPTKGHLHQTCTQKTTKSEQIKTNSITVEAKRPHS